MKSLSFIIVIFALFFTFNSTFAISHPPIKSSNIAKIELNVLEGMNSDNTGLKVGSAYLAGEIKSIKSVIPLLKMFHSDVNEKVRIQAALSLLKIGDLRGIKAIEYASRFDDSKYVRDLCKKFYCAYKNHKIDC